jgi:hypothetical protein
MPARFLRALLLCSAAPFAFAQANSTDKTPEFTCFGGIKAPAGSPLAMQGNDPWIELQRFRPEQSTLKQATAVQVLTRSRAALQKDLLLTRLSYRVLGKPSAASTDALLAASDGNALDFIEVIAANQFAPERVDALLRQAVKAKRVAQDYTTALRRASNYMQARSAYQASQQGAAMPNAAQFEACVTAIASAALPRIEGFVKACRDDALKSSKARAGLCTQAAKLLEQQADSLVVVMISSAVQGHAAQGAAQLALADQTQADWKALGEVVQTVALTANAPESIGLTLQRSLEQGEVASLLHSAERLPDLNPVIFQRLRAKRGMQ